jgi:carbamoylphosphate synthase large subunit
MLHEVGIPVPRSAVVRREEEAVAAAGRLGYPVRAEAARRQPRPGG